MMRVLLLVIGLPLTALLAQPPAEPARFGVVTATGPVRGTVRTLEAEGGLELDADERVRLEPAAWFALRRVGTVPPSLPMGLHLLTTGGDLLAIQRPRLEGERLLFEQPDLNGGKGCSVPLGAVSLIWWASPGNGTAEVLRRRLLRENRKQDYALLTNGDRVTGVPVQLDGFRLTLQTEAGNRPLDLKQVGCLVLNADLAESLRPAGRHYQILLRNRDGTETSRLALSTLTSDGQSLGGKTLFGATLRVPLDRIEAVDVMNGGAEYLTDLPLAATVQVPYLDLRWPVGIDATGRDENLRLGTTPFARGLSLSAGTRVTYRIAGKYRRLDVMVGLDPRHGRQGGVRLEVLCDGKAVPLESPDLVGAEVVRPIRVDLTNVQELTLGVQPGRHGAVQGHVNWVEPRLVK